jgi:signal transduction histidine kinase
VLERHRRLDPGDGNGAGLGLAIAETIMRTHRGRIEITDAPGGGAKVTLDFRSARL